MKGRPVTADPISITLHVRDQGPQVVLVPAVPRIDEVIATEHVAAARVYSVHWNFDRGKFVAVHVYAR